MQRCGKSFDTTEELEQHDKLEHKRKIRKLKVKFIPFFMIIYHDEQKIF
ncbi:MAG TPA: hypothetical protein VFY41_00390 [Nitrososphaeraceae archaeon]|nr:hypothetical protein [Nitrososphaeraceae archaeon]